MFGIKMPWTKAKEKRQAEEKAFLENLAVQRAQRREQAEAIFAANRKANQDRQRQSFGIPRPVTNQELKRPVASSVSISTEMPMPMPTMWDSTPTYTPPISYESGSSSSSSNSCDSSSYSSSSSSDCGGATGGDW